MTTSTEAVLLAASAREPATPLVASGRPAAARYRGLGEQWARARALVEGGAVLEILGESEQGRPLIALRLEPAGPSERLSVVLGGVHPLEWIGVEAAFTIAERLIRAAPTVGTILVVPLVNVDGYARVEANLRAGLGRFVRHNARGVDLNRNFPASWGAAQGGVGRLLPGVFAGGRGPASEPEVAALVRRLAGLRVERALSLHSVGGAVLFPWGARWERAPRHAEHQRWAEQVARGVDPGRPYRAVQSARWVPGFTARGMELDWFAAEHGALSLLVECGRPRPGLTLRALLDPFAWFNPADPAPLAAAVAAATLPFVRGAALAQGAAGSGGAMDAQGPSGTAASV